MMPLGRSAKAGVIFHFSYILFLGYKLTFAMASIGTFIFQHLYFGAF